MSLKRKGDSKVSFPCCWILGAAVLEIQTVAPFLCPALPELWTFWCRFFIPGSRSFGLFGVGWLAPIQPIREDPECGEVSKWITVGKRSFLYNILFPTVTIN